MKTEAIELLKEDHKKFKKLFRDFEKATTNKQKEEISKEIFLELTVHSKVEEELFYPALEEKEEKLVLESYEEHHQADQRIDELKEMQVEDGTFTAKFTVLREDIEHHIGEEEKELFPKAKRILGKEKIIELGEQIKERKEELMHELQVER